jgi:ubiquinone biosynthesis accessory factor UbiJ
MPVTFESPFIAALNRLLENESWARERLLPFAAETLELRAPPLPALRFMITAEGTLAPVTGAAAPSLMVTVGPGAIAAAVKGEDHLLRSIDVSGNARLASEVMFLARHLRWDVEEDLAKFVGDVAARRLTGLARDAAAWHADAAKRIAASFIEYAVEEKRVLVTRPALAEFSGAVARLRDGLERLEKRLERLDQTTGGR